MKGDSHGIKRYSSPPQFKRIISISFTAHKNIQQFFSSPLITKPVPYFLPLFFELIGTKP